MLNHIPQLIICFDIDGTLADAKQQLHPNDRQILSSNTACIFVPATGRPLHSLRHIMEGNGLFIEQRIPFPMILQNGATLYRQGEQVITHQPFNNATLEALITTLDRYKAVHHVLIGLDTVFSLFPHDFGRQLISQWAFQSSPFSDQNRSNAISKIMCLSPDPDALEAIRHTIDKLPVECAYSLAGVLEINPLGVNKATGLEQLRRHLGWRDPVICAIGDGENDLPLFHVAHHTFAPQDSPPKILKQADHLINRVDTGIFMPALEYLYALYHPQDRVTVLTFRG